MGDKMAARRVAIAAGRAGRARARRSRSPTTRRPRASRREIGYPVMIKAAMGGGGKGMRLVRAPGELAGALRAARSEAGAAFGDASVYLERYVERAAPHRGPGARRRPRQRRAPGRARVLDPAPAPEADRGEPVALRHARDAARAWARRRARSRAAVGYVNAGTVEFLVDGDRNFYFLEMNTRLQVEHPVTELVTGRDLVQEQIRIAAGEKLGFTQEDVVASGHGPSSAASTPRIRTPTSSRRRGGSPACAPRAGPGCATTPASTSGYTVPRYYDTLMAKLIVWAPDREAAIARMDARARRVPRGRRADDDPAPRADHRATGLRRRPALHPLHRAPARRPGRGARLAPHRRADRRGARGLRARGPRRRRRRRRRASAWSRRSGRGGGAA